MDNSIRTHELIATSPNVGENEQMDALLKAAFQKALQQDIDEPPSDEELELMEPVISSLDKKMRVMRCKARGAYRLDQFWQFIRRGIGI